MNKIFIYIVFLSLISFSCKPGEKSAGTFESEMDRVSIIAIELDLEKEIGSFDLEVTGLRMDTLPDRVSPLPTNNIQPELFKIEIIDPSNKILFGSQYQTEFSAQEGLEKATLKFTCTVPETASKAKVYYRESQNLWKLVEIIEL